MPSAIFNIMLMNASSQPCLQRKTETVNYGNEKEPEIKIS